MRQEGVSWLKYRGEKSITNAERDVRKTNVGFVEPGQHRRDVRSPTPWFVSACS